MSYDWWIKTANYIFTLTSKNLLFLIFLSIENCFASRVIFTRKHDLIHKPRAQNETLDTKRIDKDKEKLRELMHSRFYYIITERPNSIFVTAISY